MQSFIYAACIVTLLFMIVGTICLWANEGARTTVRQVLSYNQFDLRLPSSNSPVETAPAPFPLPEVAIAFPRPVVVHMRERDANQRSFNITVPLYRRGVFRSLGKRNAPFVIRWRSFFRVPGQAPPAPV